MDVNAGAVLQGATTLDQVGAEVYDCVIATAEGQETASESLGHQEFVMTYKHFEPIGPSCLPLAQ
jgi:altronate hydrolase